MEPELTQEEMHPEMTPEEAKASLGLSTRISEQLLMQMNPQQELTEGSGTETATDTQPIQDDGLKSEMQGMESRIMDEIASLREELKSGDNKDEITSIRDELEQALKEDGE